MECRVLEITMVFTCADTGLPAILHIVRYRQLGRYFLPALCQLSGMTVRIFTLIVHKHNTSVSMEWAGDRVTQNSSYSPGGLRRNQTKLKIVLLHTNMGLTTTPSLFRIGIRKTARWGVYQSIPLPPACPSYTPLPCKCAQQYCPVSNIRYFSM